MLIRLATLLHHSWLDAGDADRALPPEAQQRLARHIQDAETGHSGEIRISLEASLPGSYLWRHLRHGATLSDLVRQRALMQFSKLRVWDTAENNGVLVYVLLAEHRIELVADRAIHRLAGEAAWHAVVDRLGTAIAAGQLEQGLVSVVDALATLLRQHFPLQPGQVNPNELTDAPTIG